MNFVNFDEVALLKSIIMGLVPRSHRLKMPRSHQACLDYIWFKSKITFGNEITFVGNDKLHCKEDYNCGKDIKNIKI